MSEPLDVIIIGAGSAGLAALREVRKRTDRFVLINDGPYGTTCARVGCMPSKVLIEAANAFHARGKLEAFGVRGAEALAVDIPAVLRRVRELRDYYVASTLKATADLGERNIAGRARLLDAQRVQVGERVLSARRIVIATGSRPIVPPAWQGLGDRVLTSDTLFDQKSLPRRIGVIGLGPVGIEMAQALARLGLEVTAFGQDEWLAGLTDEKVNAALRARLEKEFAVNTGTPADLSLSDEGIVVRAGSATTVVDRVVVAVGRRANLDGIGLETLGVALDERGMPPFDSTTMRIGDLPVFIAGDASNRAPLLHEAADEGHIAGRNALEDAPNCYRRRTPLGIVFVDPGVAFVGQRHADLEDSAAVGEIDFAHQGRARAAQRNYGLMRIYASRSDARVLGAEMCVPAAEHMGHLLALAIEQNLTVFDLLRLPFYHPVLEEGMRSALRELARQLGGSGGSDLADCEGYRCEALD